MNVLDQLKAQFGSALPEGADRAAFELAVRPATDAKFGDYQANGCLATLGDEKSMTTVLG